MQQGWTDGHGRGGDGGGSRWRGLEGSSRALARRQREACRAGCRWQVERSLRAGMGEASAAGWRGIERGGLCFTEMKEGGRSRLWGH